MCVHANKPYKYFTDWVKWILPENIAMNSKIKKALSLNETSKFIALEKKHFRGLIGRSIFICMSTPGVTQLKKRFCVSHLDNNQSYRFYCYLWRGYRLVGMIDSQTPTWMFQQCLSKSFNFLTTLNKWNQCYLASKIWYVINNFRYLNWLSKHFVECAMCWTYGNMVYLNIRSYTHRLTIAVACAFQTLYSTLELSNLHLNWHKKSSNILYVYMHSIWMWIYWFDWFILLQL